MIRDENPKRFEDGRLAKLVDVIPGDLNDPNFEDDQDYFIETYLVEPESLFEEISRDKKELSDGQIEVLEVYLSAAKERIAGQLTETPATERAGDANQLGELAELLEHSFVKDSEIKRCDENKNNVAALRMFAHFFHGVVEDWLTSHWVKEDLESASAPPSYKDFIKEQGRGANLFGTTTTTHDLTQLTSKQRRKPQTQKAKKSTKPFPQENLNLMENILLAGWFSLDFRAVENAQNMVDSLLAKNKQRDKYRLALIALKDVALLDFLEINKVQQEDWRTSTDAKIAYQERAREHPDWDGGSVEIPLEYPIWERITWDNGMRRKLTNDSQDLLHADALCQLLGFMQHYEHRAYFAERTNPDEEKEVEALLVDENLWIRSTMLALQDSPTSEMWQFLAMHEHLPFGSPRSRAYIAQKAESSRFKDPEYQDTLRDKVTEAYVAALGEMTSLGSVTEEGFDEKELPTVFPTYLAYTMFPEVHFEDRVRIWERSRRIYDTYDCINNYGSPLATQGNRFTLQKADPDKKIEAKNLHLEKHGVTSLTLWAATDKYPSSEYKNGIAVEIVVEGIDYPFQMILTNNLVFHFSHGGEEEFADIPPQLNAHLVDLVLMHTEAISLGPRRDREPGGELGHTVKENEEGERVNKYGPHLSLVPGEKRARVKESGLLTYFRKYKAKAAYYPTSGEVHELERLLEKEEDEDKRREYQKDLDEAEIELIKEAISIKQDELKRDNPKLVHQIRAFVVDDVYDSILLKLLFFPKFNLERFNNYESENPHKEATIKSGWNHESLLEEDPFENTFIRAGEDLSI